nr:glycosyltransferase family 2 protein [Rhizobium sp. Q54]
MQDHHSFGVVICVHSDERLCLAIKAIQSVATQTHQPDEIIVVCDHNPGLAERLSHECPQARVIPNRYGKGLSGARNSGWEAVHSDIVAFLDDDAEAAPDWLSRLSGHYANPCVMGVGGNVEAVWQQRRPSWFAKEFDWIVGCSYRGLPVKAAPVRNLIGCNMSFRREIISMLGGFREAFGRDGANAFGCEETDFCIRASQMFPGWRIIYDPEVSVRHHVPTERASFSYFMRRCLAEGRSKALLVMRNGHQRGLSSERNYIWKTLSTGIARELGGALRGRVSGLDRAATIVAGFLGTAAGYLDYRVRRRPRGGSPDDFQPVQIVEVNLDDPPTGNLLGENAMSREFGGILILVRKYRRPVGMVELPAIRPLIDTQLLRWLLTAHIQREVLDPVPVPLHPVPVTVVVATRDRVVQLSRCLESLLDQNYPDFEIVVVDNAPSDDRTQRLIDDRFRARVRYVCEPRPGLAQAHNAGILHARHELIAFTDDDVICDRGWLAAIVSAFETADDVGCVTGLILPMELQTRAQYWTERHGGYGKGFQQKRFDAQSGGGDVLYPLTAGQFGSGAAMAFRRSALERIGRFDPALGAGTKARGGDDLQSFASTILSGLAIIYEPAAMTWHQHRREEAGMQRQAYGYGVGLGAYLTSILLRRPDLAWSMIRRLPAAVTHMMGRHSSKMMRLPADYPRSFVWIERLGILMGPYAYLESRRGLPKVDRRIAKHQAEGTTVGVREI